MYFSHTCKFIIFRHDNPTVLYALTKPQFTITEPPVPGISHVLAHLLWILDSSQNKTCPNLQSFIPYSL